MTDRFDPHRAHPDTVLALLQWHLEPSHASNHRGFELAQALRAQCLLPPLPTTAELDRDVAAVARAWVLDRAAHHSVYDRLLELCKLRPAEASGTPGAAAKESREDIAAPGDATSSPDERPCGCEETEGLRLEVGRLRALTEDRHAPNTLEWRKLVDELRGQLATIRGLAGT